MPCWRPADVVGYHSLPRSLRILTSRSRALRSPMVVSHSWAPSFGRSPVMSHPRPVMWPPLAAYKTSLQTLAGILTTTFTGVMLTITSGSFVVPLVVAGVLCFSGLCRICFWSAQSNLCPRSIQTNWSRGQSDSVKVSVKTANIATSVASIVSGSHKSVAELRSPLSSQSCSQTSFFARTRGSVRGHSPSTTPDARQSAISSLRTSSQWARRGRPQGGQRSDAFQATQSETAQYGALECCIQIVVSWILWMWRNQREPRLPG
jgi:hypothetical protein